jgi:RNA recognition motif-containing protein
MNIFVGNLSFDSVEADVQKLFEGFGNVASVAIVMRKEKKAPKSRGFGFVQMPDEQQALAAIAVLNGKEFMGRIINVDPARPKTEAQAESKLTPVRITGSIGETNIISKGAKEKRQPGRYKGGRRTYSYMKRRGLAGMQEEVKPRQRNQDNPMRWRKRKDQPRPWQKSSGEPKPWKKAEEGGRPPRKKTGGESKPGHKSEGGFKPWSKSREHPQFKGRKKAGGYKR